jgi:dienelactone hydrolase
MVHVRWIRRGAILLGLLTLVSVAYIGFCAVTSRRTVNLPELSGRNAVGRQEFDWVDKTRADRLDPRRPGHQPRRLSVWMWYPARRGPGSSGSYAPGAWDTLHFPGVVGLGETSFSRIRIRAVEGAEPLRRQHVLVVLAPGLGLAAPQYQSLAETLASHGYVVAGYTPTYSANVSVVGGRVVRPAPGGTLPDDSLYRPAVRTQARRLLSTWVADMEFVARRARSAIEGVEVGRRVVFVGHSFGGASSLEACHEMHTCVGAVNMDGLDVGSVEHSGLRVPTLLLGHANSCVTGVCRPESEEDRRDRSTARSMIAAGDAPTWSVTLEGTGHFDFTDYAAYRLALPLRRLLPLGSRSGRKSLLITERCLLDFADQVRGSRPRWGCLSGSLDHTRSTSWSPH